MTSRDFALPAMEMTLNTTFGKQNSAQQDHRFPVISIQRVTSKVLLAGARELVIEHAGREYRLRLTGNGKLILTA